ncbi:MAG TPA: DUF5808 domain-containing protein [Candidatus Dormibacteraeota bacterium]|nr:DUF5808 domain-containing protein [Candidatus Dormibacteraeota bacterium]
MIRVAVFGLVVAAVATELTKPPEERTWRGRVGGVVPYDFRPPTWRRIREAYWNPESDSLFSDRVFGVGWAVNLYRARTLMEDTFRKLMGKEDAVSIRMSVHAERGGGQPDVVITRE